MEKYNRTFHLPCSREVHSDDKKMKHIKDLIGVEVVLTEKLDGGNCALVGKKVFARTHSSEANHGSFSRVKNMSMNLYSCGHLRDTLKVFGENMQGVHTIEYSELTSPFYIFNLFENGLWKSWEEVEEFSLLTGVPTAPVIFKGVFKTEKELFSFIDSKMDEPSLLGGDREGVVVRVARAFSNKEFETFVGKSVRKDHVQTDEHWSGNWKEAKIKKVI